MNKLEKVNFVNELEQKLRDSNFVVLLSHNGLKFSDIYVLRRKLQLIGAKVLFSKNTLGSIAMQRFEGKFSELLGCFSGAVFVVMGNDSHAAFRILNDFVSNLDSAVMLGGVSNNVSLSVEQIKSVASVGSLDDARSKMIGMISGVQSKFARLLSMFDQSKG